MFDNMVKKIFDKDDNQIQHYDISLLESAVKLVRYSNSGAHIITEASGNINLESIAIVAKSGVDSISCGALTQYFLYTYICYLNFYLVR